MASIAKLLRGSEHEFFDLFERAGANSVRAAELLDAMLAGYPETAAVVVIRWKDIFERLENAIDSAERTAFILEGIVIKNA